MKKCFVIATIVLLVFALSWTKLIKKHIPLSPPNMDITYNKNEIETVKNEYTWCDKPDGGSTHTANDPFDLAKGLKAVSVKKGGEINFTFNTLLKQPSKTVVYLAALDKNNPFVEQAINTNSFNVPKETGEYTYSIFAWWDEGHSVTYVFKIKTV